MANRCVALIGKGTGPAVRVRGGTGRPVVSGLQEGEYVELTAYDSGMQELSKGKIEENGTHDETTCYYARFSYQGSNRRLICSIVSGG